MLLKKPKQKNQLIPLIQTNSQKLLSQQIQPFHYSTNLLNPQKPISYLSSTQEGFLKQNQLCFGLDVIDQEQSSQTQIGLKQQLALEIDQIIDEPNVAEQEHRSQEIKSDRFQRRREIIQEKVEVKKEENILFKYMNSQEQQRPKTKSLVQKSQVEEIFISRQNQFKEFDFTPTKFLRQSKQSKEQQVLIKKPTDNSFLKSKFYSTLGKFKSLNIKQDLNSNQQAQKKEQPRQSQRYRISEKIFEKLDLSRIKPQKSEKSQKIQIISRIQNSERSQKVQKIQNFQRIQKSERSSMVKMEDEAKNKKDVISSFKNHIEKINNFKQNEKKRHIISTQEDIQQNVFNFKIEDQKKLKKLSFRKTQQQKSLSNRPESVIYSQTNKKAIFNHHINEKPQQKITISYKTTLLQLKQLCLRQDKHQLLFEVTIPEILQKVFFTQFDSQKSIFEKANNIFKTFGLSKENVISIKKYSNCIMIFSGKLLLLYYYSNHVYLGQWSQNKKNGIGLEWFPNKSVYYGQFVNGNRHGFGIINDSNGKTLIGLWSNNYFIN